MAYVMSGEWLPDLKYQGPAFQDRDEVYHKCYAGGDAGYVGLYEDYSPGSTVLIQMQGNSRVENKSGTSLYYATWVNDTKRDTEALTFTVKKKDGKTWLEARKQGGGSVVPREFVCVNGQKEVLFDSTQDMNLAYLQFSGGGHVGFVAKTRKIGLFAEKRSDGRWYLNTDAKGLECVFVPEKVQDGDINWSKPFTL